MMWRTFLVILLFWAALMVITPILIRLSASANVLDYNGEMKNGGIRSIKEAGLLSRRTLGFIQKERPATSPSSLLPLLPSSLPSPSPSPSSSTSPSPSPSPSQNFRQTTFELEVSHDTIITLHP